MIAFESNCAKYYNCSKGMVAGQYVEECPYPDLFSIGSKKCDKFENVSCQNRTEPMAPCTYYTSYI